MTDLLRKPFGTQARCTRSPPKVRAGAMSGSRSTGCARARARPKPRARARRLLVMIDRQGRHPGGRAGLGRLGDRMNVFEKSPPHCLYVPDGQRLARPTADDRLHAGRLLGAGRRAGIAARRIGPGGHHPDAETRAAAPTPATSTTSRWRRRITADSLLVTEVFTPAGPLVVLSQPHRHDEGRFSRA